MTIAETKILPRLVNVNPRGRGSWMASCPAHDDKSPSLVITEQDDGRILVHCFAGCAPVDVLDAIGLSMSDLFPDGPFDHRIKGDDPNKKKADWSKAYRVLNTEMMIILLAGEDLLAGKALAPMDQERLHEAVSKVRVQAKNIGILK